MAVEYKTSQESTASKILLLLRQNADTYAQQNNINV